MASIKEDTIIHLDFTVQPPCESTVHGEGGVHSGAAAYWQDGECAHTTGFRCASYVAAVKKEAETYVFGPPCDRCGAQSRIAGLRFTAI